MKKLTRKGFVRKWLDTGRLWTEMNKAEMMADLDRVINLATKQFAHPNKISDDELDDMIKFTASQFVPEDSDQPTPDKLNGWIPVSEKLPEEMEFVIIEGGVGYLQDGIWYSAMSDLPHRKIKWSVTHWQPLPVPPINKTNENNKS